MRCGPAAARARKATSLTEEIEAEVEELAAVFVDEAGEKLDELLEYADAAPTAADVWATQAPYGFVVEDTYGDIPEDAGFSAGDVARAIVAKVCAERDIDFEVPPELRPSVVEGREPAGMEL